MKNKTNEKFGGQIYKEQSNNLARALRRQQNSEEEQMADASEKSAERNQSNPS